MKTSFESTLVEMEKMTVSNYLIVESKIVIPKYAQVMYMTKIILSKNCNQIKVVKQKGILLQIMAKLIKISSACPIRDCESTRELEVSFTEIVICLT